MYLRAREFPLWIIKVLLTDLLTYWSTFVAGESPTKVVAGTLTIVPVAHLPSNTRDAFRLILCDLDMTTPLIIGKKRGRNNARLF